MELQDQKGELGVHRPQELFVGVSLNTECSQIPGDSTVSEHQLSKTGHSNQVSNALIVYESMLNIFGIYFELQGESLYC